MNSIENTGNPDEIKKGEPNKTVFQICTGLFAWNTLISDILLIGSELI